MTTLKKTVLATALTCFCLGTAAKAVVIADWQFNNNATDMLLDSSGNGHTLANSGNVTWSSANGGSAVFNGTAASILKTVATLNLTSYTQLTFEYGFKTTSGVTGILFEDGSNWSSSGQTGAFQNIMNGTSGNGYAQAGQRTSAGYNLVQNNSYPMRISDGTLRNMKITIDSTDATASRLMMYRDGVSIGTSAGGLAAQAFLDRYLNIGARADGTFAVTGEFSYLTISSVPEPSSALLIGAAGVIVLIARRRNKNA